MVATPQIPPLAGMTPLGIAPRESTNSYEHARRSIPDDAEWTSSFGNPGEGGYCEFFKRGVERYRIDNGARFAFTPTWRAIRCDHEAPAVERETLAGQVVDQGLIPGVEATSHAAREIAARIAAKAARRGSAPPPAGGLFDQVARDQLDLF